MQNLIKQSRLRFSANTQESSSFKDRQIPPQKTESSKGEKKRGQNWFQRQFSGQMSQSYDFDNGIEKIVAVAAAAYVIDSIEKSRIQDQKTIDLDSVRSSGHADSEVPIATATETKGPAKAADSAPAIKKTLTFSDRPLERSNTFTSRTPSKPDLPSFKPITPDVTTIKPESEATKAGMPTIKNGSAATRAEIPTAKPGHAAQKTDIPTTPSAAQKTDIHATKPHQPQTIRPATGEIEAQNWERAEMARIKERYEKLNSTILEWENRKKTKATNKLHKAEGELELRRAKALKKFQNDMEYIKQVAGGARAQAEERRRNDELKAKEKANIIRTTGRVPTTCFCL